MGNVEISVAIITAILGVGYPILLEVVSRLDEKYTSQVILQTFDQERPRRYFSKLLIAAISSVGLYMLRLPVIPVLKYSFQQHPSILSGLEHSAELIMSLVAGILVVNFLILIKKVFIYYTPSRILNYLFTAFSKRKSKDDYTLFEALSDVLFFAIRKRDYKIVKTISDKFYPEFRLIRDNVKDTPVEYPGVFYDMVTNLMKEVVQANDERFFYLADRSTGGRWLIGEFTDKKISERTYNVLWYCMSYYLKQEKDEYILNLWENAHQHFAFNLNHIPEEYDDKWQVTNQATIDVRIDERKRFLEFFMALGAQLLYEKRIDTLEHAFNYTQAIPVRYELLPQSMADVINWYFHFLDPYDMTNNFIGQKYPFPGLSGLNSDHQIKAIIIQYCALLYLRQFTITPQFTYEAPLKLPAAPKTQGDLKIWIDYIQPLIDAVEIVYMDKTILDQIGFSALKDDWFVANKKPHPIDHLVDYKAKLSEAFAERENDQEISAGKVKKFEESTLRILENTLDAYKELYQQPEPPGETVSRFINGYVGLPEKNTFAENQGFEHLNFDTFPAEAVSEKIKKSIPHIFDLASSKKYLIPFEDFEDAINRLKILPHEFAIVSFGDFAQILAGADGLKTIISKYTYIHFDHTNNEVDDSVFILKRSDLPRLAFNDIKEEWKKEYNLVKISDRYKIYATVIDLNKNKAVREEMEKEGGTELNKKVYQAIFLEIKLQIKKGAKMVKVKPYSAYRAEGIANKLEDIVPFQ